MILKDILDAGGASYRTTSKDDELIVNCPFCRGNGFSQDDKYHLGLNVVKALAHCYRCGYKARGLFYVARQLCRVYGVKMDLMGLRRAKQETKITAPVKEEPVTESDILKFVPEYESFSRDKKDPVQRSAYAYLKQRGVSVYQIVKHEIGFAAVSDMAWRVLFPVRTSEGIAGCVGRAIRPCVKPKYLNTTGLKSLWNAENPLGTAVVVEGVMDALRVEQALLHLRNGRAVARLGSAITPLQLDQLKAFDDVIILPDFDVAGVHGAIELATQCADNRIRVKVAVPHGMSGADPGSMEDTDIVDYIKSAAQWSKAVEWRLRESAIREELVDI